MSALADYPAAAADRVETLIADMAGELAARHPGTTADRWTAPAAGYVLDTLAKLSPGMFTAYAKHLGMFPTPF